MSSRYAYVIARTGMASLLLLLSLGAIAGLGDTVQVSNAWVRETVPGQSVGAAYIRIKSKERIDLIGVQSSVAKSAELHQMSMKDGVMRMREVTTVRINSDKDIELNPGGMHIMLVDVKRPLKVGEVVELKLTFRQRDRGTFVVTVPAQVEARTAGAMYDH